jgi:hypothetical protein
MASENPTSALAESCPRCRLNRSVVVLGAVAVTAESPVAGWLADTATLGCKGTAQRGLGEKGSRLLNAFLHKLNPQPPQ